MWSDYGLKASIQSGSIRSPAPALNAFASYAAGSVETPVESGELRFELSSDPVLDGRKSAVQMNTAAEIPKRSASARACRALISRLPLNTSLTFDCAPKIGARSA